MALDQETIDLIINAENLTAKELEKVTEDLDRLGKEALEADQNLSKVTIDREQLKRFIELKDNIQLLRKQVVDTAAANKKYIKSVKDSGKETAAQTKKIEKNKLELADLKSALRKSVSEQDKLNTSLRKSGVDITHYNRSLTKLNDNYVKQRKEVTKTNRIFRKHGEVQDKAIIKNEKAIAEKRKLIDAFHEEGLALNKLIDDEKVAHEINNQLIADEKRKIELDKQAAAEIQRVGRLRAKANAMEKSIARQNEISNRRKKRQIQLDRELAKETKRQVELDKKAAAETERVKVATSRYEKELAKLNLRLKKGKISHEQFIRSEKKLRSALKLTEKQAKRTGASLDKINHKKARKSTDALTKVTRRLAQAYTVLIAAQTAAAAVGESVKSYGELETAMTKVEKTTNLTKEQLIELTDQFTKLSSESTPTATNELLRFGEIAGQLGAESSEDILRIAAAADALSVSTDLAGDEAVTLLTRMLQMTGEGIPAIGNLSSSMVELGNQTASTESEIAQMTKDILTGTSSIKLGSAAAAGFGATLKEMGQAGERSRSSLFKLSQAIKDAAVNGGKQLEKLSRVTKKTGDEIKRDLGDKPEKVLLAFVKGLKKIKDEGGLVSETLTEFGITGVEATSVIEVLADKVDRLERNVKLSNDAFVDGTKHLQEASKAYATQDAQLAKLTNRFTELKAAVGKALADEVSSSVEGLNTKLQDSEVYVQELANSFGEMIKGLNEAFSDLDDEIGGIGTVVKGMAAQVRILFNGLQTSGRLLKISFIGIKAVILELQIAWDEFFNNKGEVDRRKKELRELRVEFKKLNDGIRQDGEDIKEALSDFANESSATYRNLIESTTKYSVVVDRLSEKEKKQLKEAKKGFVQGEESAKLYINLTSRLVALNNQRNAEIELIKSTTEQRKKDNEELKKTKDDLEKMTGLLNSQGVTVEGLKDRLKLLKTEYELTGAVASQFTNDQKQLSEELEKSKKSYGEIQEKLKQLTGEFNAGGTDIRKYVKEQTELEKELSDVADEMSKTEAAIKKNEEAMVKGKEATKKYNREVALTEEAIKKLSESQDKSNKGISESIIKTDLLTETYGHNADAILTLVKAQQDLKLTRDKLEKKLTQLTKKNKEYETTLLELQKVTDQLAQNESDLNTIRQLENLTLQELKVVQEDHQRQLDLINQSYEKGQITLAQRDEQLGKLKFKTDFLSNAIGNNTEEVDKNTEAIKDNNTEKEKAVEYTSAFLDSQEKLNKEFDFSSSSVEELTSRYKKLDSELIRITSTTSDWWKQTNTLNNQAVRREQQIISETIKLRRLEEQVNSGTLSVRELDKAASRAANGFRLLGDKQLDPLRQAISDAKAEFQDLDDTINDSFSDIEDRLDAALGNEQAIVKRQFEREMNDLLDLLDKAKQSGDNKLIQKINQAIRDLKKAQDLEFKSQFGTDNTTNNNSNSNSDNGNSNGFGGGGSNQSVTVTLNLNGTTSTINVADQASADALVSAMEALGEINSQGIG